MSLRKPDPATRLLLVLWSLGGVVEPVKRGELMKGVKIGGETSGAFTPIVEALVADGAITIPLRLPRILVNCKTAIWKLYFRKRLKSLRVSLISKDYSVHHKDLKRLLRRFLSELSHLFPSL